MRRSARSERVKARRRAAPASRAGQRPAPPATVLVHPGLLHTIARAVAPAGELETGGPLIGTLERSWTRNGGSPDLIVSLLGTVPPGPALRAAESWVALGQRDDGERAGAAIRWWREVTGLDLIHLGDWHKHDPRCPEPSTGDRATAKEMHAGVATPLWLAAIAVGESTHKKQTSAEGNCARTASSEIDYEEVRFYRAAAGVGLKPVPVRVDGDGLPGLPPLPWHVADPARFSAECRLLAAAGFAVAIEASNSRARPGLILRLSSVAKPGFTIVTGSDYPVEPPVLRDAAGSRVKMNDTWSSGRFLVDLVRKQ